MRFDPDFELDPLSEFGSKFGPQHAKLIDGKVIPCTLKEWVEWKIEEQDAMKIVAR